MNNKEKIEKIKRNLSIIEKLKSKWGIIDDSIMMLLQKDYLNIINIINGNTNDISSKEEKQLNLIVETLEIILKQYEIIQNPQVVRKYIPYQESTQLRMRMYVATSNPSFIIMTDDEKIDYLFDQQYGSLSDQQMLSLMLDQYYEKRNPNISRSIDKLLLKKIYNDINTGYLDRLNSTNLGQLRTTALFSNIKNSPENIRITNQYNSSLTLESFCCANKYLLNYDIQKEIKKNMLLDRIENVIDELLRFINSPLAENSPLSELINLATVSFFCDKSIFEEMIIKIQGDDFINLLDQQKQVIVLYEKSVSILKKLEKRVGRPNDTMDITKDKFESLQEMCDKYNMVLEKKHS